MVFVVWPTHWLLNFPFVAVEPSLVLQLLLRHLDLFVDIELHLVDTAQFVGCLGCRMIKNFTRASAVRPRYRVPHTDKLFACKFIIQLQDSGLDVFIPVEVHVVFFVLSEGAFFGDLILQLIGRIL